jgi:rhomboid family GlyGly-CTERM serine protease
MDEVDLSLSKITFSPRLETSSLTWATGFALILLSLQLLPPELHRALWFDRQAIEAGEYWRILTGNLVHLGWAHLFLNVGALLIGIWIFYPGRTPLGWIVAQLTCAITTSLGLLLFSPQISWCVGMSGALHGLLIIGAIDWIRAGDRAGWLLLAVWTGKIAWEHWRGALPFSAETVGAPVVTDAHLWGAAGGLLFVAGESLWRHWRASPAPA